MSTVAIKKSNTSLGAGAAQPGDTLLISENIDKLIINNLKGTKDKPIVLTANEGVVIGGYSNLTIQMIGCAFMQLKGLKIKGVPSAIGIKAYVSTDLTFEDIDIDTCSIGLQIKTDVGAAENTYYPTCISNIVVRRVHVKNAEAEGFYLGHTFTPVPPAGKIPPPIKGLILEHCSAENTGWDGFQITNAQDVTIYNIGVVNAATKNQGGQNAGITIQDAVVLKEARMLTVNGSKGNGLNFFGKGLSIIENVELYDIGTTGIFVDNRSDRGLKLPAQQLKWKNIKLVGGGSGQPYYNLNGAANGAVKSIPGTITNFVWDKTEWPQGIRDNASTAFLTEEPPVVDPPVQTKTLIFSLTDEVQKKNYKLYADATGTLSLESA